MLLHNVKHYSILFLGRSKASLEIPYAYLSKPTPESRDSPSKRRSVVKQEE